VGSFPGLDAHYSVPNTNPRTPIFAPATFTPLLDANNNPTGEDLLLTDVLSFDIQVLTSVAVTATTTAGQATSTEFGDLPSPYYFDTWSRRKDDKYDYATTTGLTGAPVPTGTAMRIVALQITIRIFDQRSQLARQITMIQYM